MGLLNAATRRLGALFPGYFENTKHNHYADFGWPETLTFAQFYAAYDRNAHAAAAIDGTISKTWQDNPALYENEKPKETPLEAEIRQRFDDLRIWQKLAEADRRSMVGAYGGAILRLADDRLFREPVDTVRGGLDGLVDIIPAWEGQLTVSEWHTDERQPEYGTPKMYSFNEAAVGETSRMQSREIHPDRVLIWSADGTINGKSSLRAGFNDLMTMEKIRGAGGEGFWKNAKSAPIFETRPDLNADDMAAAMGVHRDDIRDRMDEEVADYQRGFDKLLMIQGMTAKTLPVTLPSPEHFHAIAERAFAATYRMPTKILSGNQEGSLASTADEENWAQTNMGRRKDRVIPAIRDFAARIERFGIIPERDWIVNWSDLTEASMGEKIDRADKMAGINQKLSASGMGQEAYSPDEIRAVTGHEPMTEIGFGDDE